MSYAQMYRDRLLKLRKSKIVKKENKGIDFDKINNWNQEIVEQYKRTLQVGSSEDKNNNILINGVKQFSNNIVPIKEKFNNVKEYDFVKPEITHKSNNINNNTKNFLVNKFSSYPNNINNLQNNSIKVKPILNQKFDNSIKYNDNNNSNKDVNDNNNNNPEIKEYVIDNNKEIPQNEIKFKKKLYYQ